MKIDNKYAAVVLIEILYEKGLVNKETYMNVKNSYKSQCEGDHLHISQMES